MSAVGEGSGAKGAAGEAVVVVEAVVEAKWGKIVCKIKNKNHEEIKMKTCLDPVKSGTALTRRLRLRPEQQARKNMHRKS